MQGITRDSKQILLEKSYRARRQKINIFEANVITLDNACKNARVQYTFYAMTRVDWQQ